MEEAALEEVNHVLPTFSPNICKDRHLTFDMSFGRTLRAIERGPWLDAVVKILAVI